MTITRRAALTGTVAGAAAIVAGTVPALANAHPDSELLAFGREYDAIYEKIMDAYRRIDLVAPPRHDPVEPEALRVRPGDEALGMPRPFNYGTGGVDDTYRWNAVDQLRGKVQVRAYVGPIKLERLEYAGFKEIMDAVMAYSTARDVPWPEAQARADEIVAAFDAYNAELKWPADATEAVGEIEDEIDAYRDELRPVAEAIVATRVVTLDGLLVKARAVRWIYQDDPEQLMAEAEGRDDELSRSITTDLWAMQERQS